MVAEFQPAGFAEPAGADLGDHEHRREFRPAGQVGGQGGVIGERGVQVRDVVAVFLEAGGVQPAAREP